jgi:hypothetical protein
VSAAGVDVASEGRVRYDPPLPLLKLPHRAGGGWAFEATFNRGGGGTGTVVGRATAHGPEEVKVPAGTFRCVRVERTVRADGFETRETFWLAPGVGQVKRVSTGQHDSTRVLKSFTPAKD